MDRPPANSSAVERGEVPEVAELGNTLTGLFNTLGVSQRAYAVRVTLDPSVVSRYLRGQRVATEDFVDRLIREVEARLGTPLQEAARARVRDQRLAALRATDPALHELETVRQEAAHARRTVARLGREQDALHDRMDRLEAELAAANTELEQQRTDWARDQTAARRRELELRAAAERDRGAREALEAELARLRAHLADLTALRADAESRCRALEDRVLGLEEELGALRAGRGGPEEEPGLPVAVMLDRVSAHLVAGELREVTRALDAAAWERPADELVRILAWLVEMGARHRAEWMVGLVCEYRSLDVVAELGSRLPALGREAALDRELLSHLMRTGTPQDLARLHAAWSTAQDGHRGAGLLTEAVRTAKGADLAALLALVDDAGATVHAVHKASRRDFQPRRLFGLARRLSEQGHEALAAAVLTALVDLTKSEPGGAAAFVQAFGALVPSRRADLGDRIVAVATPPRMLLLLDALYGLRNGERVADELLARVRDAEGALPALLAEAREAYPPNEPETASELRELLLLTYVRSEL
ncbi:hypothetical protein [Streptomyces sp. NRRL S-87]|uniref:hypothetical protein n=1 Tax=Streptomyces sp. NRRL S-87 TaxID=1463920 RepID=UPI00131D0665|nr:hypothetical protein [Streptomyces sp. NRRL S-87]